MRPELPVDEGRFLDTPAPGRPRPDDDVLHRSEPAITLLDRRRAVDLHRDRIHGIDGGEAVDDQRHLVAPRGNVLVLPGASQVLVAPNQNIVSVELEADHVSVGLPRRGHRGEPGEALSTEVLPLLFGEHRTPPGPGYFVSRS